MQGAIPFDTALFIKILYKKREKGLTKGESLDIIIPALKRAAAGEPGEKKSLTNETARDNIYKLTR
ncbi:hypothetical protein [Pectinatus frisingensis]|uniref:hypothetical protein n=1 Tax=Pectinatus frisingensis TaxID=865 RepID=UPI003D804C5B